MAGELYGGFLVKNVIWRVGKASVSGEVSGWGFGWARSAAMAGAHGLIVWLMADDRNAADKSWMPVFLGGGAKGSSGAKHRWKGPGGMTREGGRAEAHVSRY